MTEYGVSGEGGPHPHFASLSDPSPERQGRGRAAIRSPSPEIGGGGRRRRGVGAPGLWHYLFLFLLLGCQNELHEQPGYHKPFEVGAARPLAPHTVARGTLQEEAPDEGFPFEITRERLVRGRARYEIFCAPCHGLTGDGQGLIVQRGFPEPSSFHTEELRAVPPAYLVEAITEGTGDMLSYAEQVPYEDRWAIAAYIQVLQLSQNATLDDVPPSEREGLGP